MIKYKGGMQKWDPCTESLELFKFQLIQPGPYFDESLNIIGDKQP